MIGDCRRSDGLVGAVEVHGDSLVMSTFDVVVVVIRFLATFERTRSVLQLLCGHGKNDIHVSCNFLWSLECCCICGEPSLRFDHSAAKIVVLDIFIRLIHSD
jgi:hypothetical protein